MNEEDENTDKRKRPKVTKVQHISFMVTSLKNEAIKWNCYLVLQSWKSIKNRLIYFNLESLGLKIKLNVGLVWLIYFI